MSAGLGLEDGENGSYFLQLGQQSPGKLCQGQAEENWGPLCSENL